MSNITINDSTDAPVGFFGISQGTIKNVNLDYETVVGRSAYTGGLVGYQVAGEIIHASTTSGCVSAGNGNNNISGNGGVSGGLESLNKTLLLH